MLENMIKEFELINDDDEFEVWIHPFIMDAVAETSQMKLLMDFISFLEKRAYIYYKLYILEDLYQRTYRIDFLLELARTHLYMENYVEAQHFIDLVDESDVSPESELMRAQLLRLSGYLYAAKKILKQLINDYPTFYQSYLEMALVLSLEGDIKQAIYYYNVLLNYFEKSIDVEYVRHQLLLLYSESELLEFSEIESFINNEEYPLKSSEDLAIVAQLYLNYNQFEAAETYAFKAIALDKDNVLAHLVLLETYRALGQKKKAIGKIEWFVDNIPELDERMFYLVEISNRLEYYQENIAQIAKNQYYLSSDIDQRQMLIDYIVKYYLSVNKANLALDYLKNLDDPLMDEYYLSLEYARVYRALSIYHDVPKLYEQALEQLVSEEDAVYEYADFLVSQEEYQQALDLSEKYYRTFYDTLKLRDLRDQLRLKKIDDQEI